MAITLPTPAARTSAISPTKCSVKFATMRATILIGCFRKSDANDPAIYLSAVVAVLTKYRPEVVEAITDPTTGLPAKLKWLPAIAEIVEACEAAANEQAEARRRNQPSQRLPEPYISADERRRVGEQMKALAAELRAKWKFPDTSEQPF